MKIDLKEIKAQGRRYAKKAFALEDEDRTELMMLEKAFAAGYRLCEQTIDAGLNDDINKAKKKLRQYGAELRKQALRREQLKYANDRREGLI